MNEQNSKTERTEIEIDETCVSCGGTVEIRGNELCITCDYEYRQEMERLDRMEKEQRNAQDDPPVKLPRGGYSNVYENAKANLEKYRAETAYRPGFTPAEVSEREAKAVAMWSQSASEWEQTARELSEQRDNLQAEKDLTLIKLMGARAALKDLITVTADFADMLHEMEYPGAATLHAHVEAARKALDETS